MLYIRVTLDIHDVSRTDSTTAFECSVVTICLLTDSPYLIVRPNMEHFECYIGMLTTGENRIECMKYRK